MNIPSEIDVNARKNVSEPGLPSIGSGKLREAEQGVEEGSIGHRDANPEELADSEPGLPPAGSDKLPGSAQCAGDGLADREGGNINSEVPAATAAPTTTDASGSIQHKGPTAPDPFADEPDESPSTTSGMGKGSDMAISENGGTEVDKGSKRKRDDGSEEATPVASAREGSVARTESRKQKRIRRLNEEIAALAAANEADTVTLRQEEARLASQTAAAKISADKWKAARVERSMVPRLTFHVNGRDENGAPMSHEGQGEVEALEDEQEDDLTSQIISDMCDEHLDSLFAALDETIKGGADKGKGKAVTPPRSNPKRLASAALSPSDQKQKSRRFASPSAELHFTANLESIASEASSPSPLLDPPQLSPLPLRSPTIPTPSLPPHSPIISPSPLPFTPSAELLPLSSADVAHSVSSSAHLPTTSLPQLCWPLPEQQLIGGPVRREPLPSWFKNVLRESDEWKGWMEFCNSCGNGGTRLPNLPAVRCCFCHAIYCVSEETRELADGTLQRIISDKGCVSVPDLAKDWLCPSCLQACLARKPEFRTKHWKEIGASEVNQKYTIRQPELGMQPPIRRKALLIIEVQCLKDEDNRPWSVAKAFVDHMKHVYGSVSSAQIRHCVFPFVGLNKKATAPLKGIQATALDFLNGFTSNEVNILITLDGHATTGDGQICYDGALAAPAIAVLLACFGTELWTCISATSGIRLFIPFVCGWIWRFQDQVDWCSRLLVSSSVEIRKEAFNPLPALITHMLGFTQLSLITHTISHAIEPFIKSVLLEKLDFLDLVKTMLLDSPTFRRQSGVVVGFTAGHEAVIRFAAVDEADKTIFGLPPPQHCGECGARVLLKSHKAHADNKRVKLPCMYAKCRNSEKCGAETLRYTPDLRSRYGDHTDTYLWNVPIRMKWVWRAVKNMKEGELEARTLLWYD